MGNTIEENIPSHLLPLAGKLDSEIRDLESGKDPEKVLSKIEFQKFQALGYEEYVGYLKRTRLSLGQPDGHGGE